MAVGQRVIVVLALRVAGSARRSSGRPARASRRCGAGPRRRSPGRSRLRRASPARGSRSCPSSSTRATVNGFSAALDARGLALLERDPDVVGSTRCGSPIPAAVPAGALRSREYGPGSGRRAQVRLPGLDGAGITIALLDTGVDPTHPYLRGRLLEGIDVLDAEGRGVARANPQDSAQVEQHGTQAAGLLIGRGGPGELHGAAPGASLLPIRVAGWQPTAAGTFAVYGRTDQMLAGLERAVDPDADGERARRRPHRRDRGGRAVRGLLGRAARARGGRRAARSTRSSSRRPGTRGRPGRATAAWEDREARPRRSPSAPPTAACARRSPGSSCAPACGCCSTASFRSAAPPTTARRWRSRSCAPRPRRVPSPTWIRSPASSTRTASAVVAGRAALLARSSSPADAGRGAADAGAAAVLVDGVVPAGALGVDERLGIPVIGLPSAVARAAREALAQGGARPGLGRSSELGGRTTTAAGSRRSRPHGLAFGGGIKPELAAPGVELLTADVGRTDGRLPRYGTMSGSSAAAALVGGAAALVVQARPELDAEALKGVLVGTAVPLRGTPSAAQGAGLVDAGAAAVAEVAAAPATVAFGAALTRGSTLRAQRADPERDQPAPTGLGRRGGRGDRGRLRHRQAATAAAPSRRGAGARADGDGGLPAARARRDHGRGPRRGGRRRRDRDSVGGHRCPPGRSRC